MSQHDSTSTQRVFAHVPDLLTGGCSSCECPDDLLVTDCPGYPIVPALRKSIRSGELDFRKGLWINPKKQKALEEEQRVRMSQGDNPQRTLVGEIFGIQVYADTSMPAGSWKLELPPEMTAPVIEAGKLFQRKFVLTESRVPIKSTVNSGGCIK